MDPDQRAAIIPLLFLIFSILVSCKERQITKSYYFWRNSSYLPKEETDFLREHKIKKLYAKCLDIDWSEGNRAYPVSINGLDYLYHELTRYDSLDIDIVPVVFITNKTFLNIDSSEIELLAKRVLRKCFRSFDSVDKATESRNSYGFTPKEIQFDCDWTVTSAKKYFYFLETIRSLSAENTVRISATIRLHQFKYPEKTGVPPVDRGMLMVYNIGNLKEYNNVNSIFDHNKAKAYFNKSKKYKLPLDIALPAYSWCIVFRDKKFYQIENEMPADTLFTSSFLRPVGNNFFRVNKDSTFFDLYLRPGDEIKLEKIDDKTILQAARLARRAVNDDSCSISLFELSSNEISNYSYETIEQVYSVFR